MSTRSIGRYVVPLALVVVLIATVVIVSSTTGGGGGGDNGSASELSPEQQRKRERRKERRRQLRQRGYVVRSGDSLEVISERTGVSRERLIELNPDLDPQALQPGQRIKLQ
jgi:hypothetical protein